MAASLTRDLPGAEELLTGNYFVAAYPPFSVWEPEQVPALYQALQAERRHAPDALRSTSVYAREERRASECESVTTPPLGMYVHLPFCQKKCDYCYYLSYIAKSAKVVDQYLESLVREMALYASFASVQGRNVSFVYFGGGTPSILGSSQFEWLADGLTGSVEWQNPGGRPTEVTFECAPRSVRADFLETLRDNGVTRVSMGVQSFDDELLQLNGRIHLRKDVLRAYALIEKAGFSSVNLDLMAGLMGESWESWCESLRRVIDLSPNSVTLYQTEVPHNTKLYRDIVTGQLQAELVPWSEKRKRIDYGFEQLEAAGYVVVSAYTAVKDPQRHPFVYQDCLWHGADMLGLGVASFGYFGGVHYQNAVALESYEQEVERGALPVQRAFSLSAQDRLVREFILQLKLGVVSLDEFRDKFGVELTVEFAGPLQALIAEGFLTCAGDEVRLTREGLLCVDALLPCFYDPQYRNIRYT